MMTSDNDHILSNLEVTDPGLPDITGKVVRGHFTVIFNANTATTAPLKKTLSFRESHAINVDSFKRDILSSNILKYCL